MKDILIVSHCILNNASKVSQDESELAEEYKQRDELIKKVFENNIQLIQLPCPEFLMYGARRWGHVKDQFDNPFFRKQCREMLESVILQIKEYVGNHDKFHIIGIVSVEGSPSCGYGLTCRAEWGGELSSEVCMNGGPASLVRVTEESGVFMEELEQLLIENNLNVPIFSISDAIHKL